MTTHPDSHAGWRTSSFGHAAGTSALELKSLGKHLGLCQQTRGRLFTLHCLAEATHGAISARFVTTLVALAALAAVVSMAL
jgi:hypothetical protein